MSEKLSTNSPENPPFIIGIDLGTTNSAVSWAIMPDAAAGDRGPRAERSPDRRIRVFEVPQLTGPGEMKPSSTLPSFLYLPGAHELAAGALALPWQPDADRMVGTFARDQGAEVPGRLVASAKSWLCHGKVDRSAPILPWGAGDDMPRVSPIDATAAYLAHIRSAWNHTHPQETAALERQLVILTVPASFDEVARELTVKAAAQAGLSQVTLLEEPLAAFYRWMIRHESNWEDTIEPGQLVLVCDVGGGTTDFTLISLTEEDGRPGFQRIAVGDHLILGGDNMDLTLARWCEQAFAGKAGRLSAHRWQELCHQCRTGKEEILSGVADTRKITIMGAGRQLIQGTVSTELSRETVETLILDGFFPLVDPDEPLGEPPRHGITEFGLPYAQDPAVTRHMIRFLERHREDIRQSLGREDIRPDFILFNGAALKPAILQERIREAVRRRFRETDPEKPAVLQNPDPELAVALGASYYGLVKKGRGVRVGSGSARAYFLSVDLQAEDETVKTAGDRAVCLVPRGMEEGSTVSLAEHDFHVLTNQPVRFDLLSSSFRTGDRAGDVVSVDDTLTLLSPLQTVIRFGKKGVQMSLPVAIEAAATEVGTLAVWCRSTRTPHRWRLQFQLREPEQRAPVSQDQVLEESVVLDALAAVDAVFGKEGRESPEKLMRILAEHLDAPKEKWPLAVIRRITDRVLPLNAGRKKTPEHESRWLNLLGFCLRPGFGEDLDSHRMDRLWKIRYNGPMHPRNPQVRSEWWILWRRAAGGLSAKQQEQLSRDMEALLIPGKGKEKKVRLAAQEQLEIWMALANLEQLSAQEKARWGRYLLDTLTPKKSRPQMWWSLSRIGAREPLYGSIDRVVSSKEVSQWIERILEKSWRNPKPVAAALAQLARLTGDRKRDLPPAVLSRVSEWLGGLEGTENYVKLIETVVPVAEREQSVIFGESIPPGLVLRV